MDITVRLSFEEGAAVRLLNWLAQENARVLREQPELPLLYDSGVVYGREEGEAWCDLPNLLARGWEDCDGLAAARAGEILALGPSALRPGDAGYEEARRFGTRRIPAEVLLRTRVEAGETGLYHCVVRYRIGGRWFQDDPSARLGMNGSIDPLVEARWERRIAGIHRRRT